MHSILSTPPHAHTHPHTHTHPRPRFPIHPHLGVCPESTHDKPRQRASTLILLTCPQVERLRPCSHHDSSRSCMTPASIADARPASYLQPFLSPPLLPTSPITAGIPPSSLTGRLRNSSLWSPFSSTHPLPHIRHSNPLQRVLQSISSPHQISFGLHSLAIP